MKKSKKTPKPMWKKISNNLDPLANTMKIQHSLPTNPHTINFVSKHSCAFNFIVTRHWPATFWSTIFWVWDPRTVYVHLSRERERQRERERERERSVVGWSEEELSKEREKKLFKDRVLSMM